MLHHQRPTLGAYEMIYNEDEFEVLSQGLITLRGAKKRDSLIPIFRQSGYSRTKGM